MRVHIVQNKPLNERCSLIGLVVPTHGYQPVLGREHAGDREEWYGQIWQLNPLICLNTVLFTRRYGCPADVLPAQRVDRLHVFVDAAAIGHFGLWHSVFSYKTGPSCCRLLRLQVHLEDLVRYLSRA